MYMHVYRSVMTRVSGSSTSLFPLSIKLSTGLHLCMYGSRGKRTGQSALVSKVNTSLGAHLKTFWSILYL